MNINGTAYRTIWREPGTGSVTTFDQTLLPHRLETIELGSMEDAARAILTMQVRGAPLIGATAAYGLALALAADASDANLAHAIDHLARQRPTAINLRWALEEVRTEVAPLPPRDRAAAAFAAAARICDDDVETCRRIGAHGLALVRAIAAAKRPGDKIALLVARRDRLTKIDVTLGADPGRPWRLETAPNATDEQKTRFETLMNGK